MQDDVLHGARRGARAGRRGQRHTAALIRGARGGHAPRMTGDRAGEAREGLFDSVAGKAKEVAGAVSGKDDLVEEGQLQQAEARKRRAAVAEEAVADAKRDEAAQELRETTAEATRRKAEARARAEREESLVEGQRRASVRPPTARPRRRRRVTVRRPSAGPRSSPSPVCASPRRSPPGGVHRAAGRCRAAPPRARGRRGGEAGRAAARPDREVRTVMISTLIALPYELARARSRSWTVA